jgi:16S rRNA (uracil1498-N3)-methyltransferase
MRRVLVGKTKVGRIELGAAESHHLRDVLRLSAGAEIEVFDKGGTTARGKIVSATSAGITVEVEQLLESYGGAPHLTIASAIPKGPRADWMIEKLSELGVDVFIPLAAERSVTLPQGASKPARWERLATESARQSGRTGVMRIGPLTALLKVLDGAAGEKAYLSLEEDANAMLELAAKKTTSELTLFIGPEGGWSAEELAMFRAGNVGAYRLTNTVLRVETAAIAAAAVIRCAVPA